MKAFQNGYIVLKEELEWLCSAMGRGEGATSWPKTETMGSLQNLGGRLALATTDTRRLHIIYLGDAIPDLKPRLANIKKASYLSNWFPYGALILNDLLSKSAIGFSMPGSRSRNALRVVDGGVEFEETRTDIIRNPEDPHPFPNIEKVMPKASTPPTEMFAINFRYLAQAGALADSSRVLLFNESPRHPLLIRPATPRPRWSAVVMPMCPSDYPAEIKKEVEW